MFKTVQIPFDFFFSLKILKFNKLQNYKKAIKQKITTKPYKFTSILTISLTFTKQGPKTIQKLSNKNITSEPYKCHKILLYFPKQKNQKHSKLPKIHHLILSIRRNWVHTQMENSSQCLRPIASHDSFSDSRTISHYDLLESTALPRSESVAGYGLGKE